MSGEGRWAGPGGAWVTPASVSRIVVYGDDMLQAVVPDSAKPFNFQKQYRLSDEQVRLYPCSGPISALNGCFPSRP